MTADVHDAPLDLRMDRLDAVTLDLDGPFSEEDRYLYVDGKPGYDGVESFLASRGISLPRGHPGDPPSAETADVVARDLGAVRVSTTGSEDR